MSGNKPAAKSRKKQVVKQPTVNRDDARLRKKPKYKSFRLHKRVKHHAPKLPNARRIARKALGLMGQNARQIAWFFSVFSILYAVFVYGFSTPVDIQEIRDSFSEVGVNEVSSLITNVTVFSLMLQSTTQAAGDVQGIYQLAFIVLSMLAFIWMFRQQQAGKRVTIKQSFYRGMFPLVPFSLVGLVALLQTLPASIGSFLYQTVVTGGLAINALEQTVWLLLYTFLIILSFYLISSTIIAMFVVTLPEMTPMYALRKAKELVQFRRIPVLWRMIALLFIILLVYIATIFPLLFVSPIASQIMFFVLTVLLVPFVAAYLFVLYRELL